MVWSPARMISAMKEEVFHTMVRQIATIAQTGELNQITGARPKRRSTSLTTP